FQRGAECAIYDRVTDAFWLLDATPASPEQGTNAPTEMDAAARAALRASGEIVPASAPRRGQTPCGVRHPIGHCAGLGGLRLDDQYGLCGGATRWLKRSFGFWEDRELKMNPLTS